MITAWLKNSVGKIGVETFDGYFWEVFLSLLCFDLRKNHTANIPN